MKKLLLIALMSIATQAHTQKVIQYVPEPYVKEPFVTGALMLNFGCKGLYEPNGLEGMELHLGVWFKYIGLLYGYSGYKLNKETKGRGVMATTIAGKVRLINEKLLLSPFYSWGSFHKDYGLRAGWRIGTGAYLGLFNSYANHYGISFTITSYGYHLKKLKHGTLNS